MVITTIGILILAAAASGQAAATEGLSRIVELNSGETVTIALAGGKQKTLKLTALREHTEPYFESASKRSIAAVVRADLTLEVDGIPGTITGGPFRMPGVINGLAILLSNSKGLSGGIRADSLAKDVRLEVADAAGQWPMPSRLVFPIRDYRWHAMNYQHTFLGIAVNQAKLYYHRGEDMGMIPDRELSLAMADAEVEKVPGPTGDGASNSVAFKGPARFGLRYAHMNTPNIFASLQPGVTVRSGAPLGLTGNTWNGRPVSDPHLHIEVKDAAADDMFRNSFPWIVEAFRASYPGELLPIAGGWRHLYAGETIELDGSLSLAGKGRSIRSYDWLFTDGSTAKGKSASHRYSEPGAYSEQLTVTDDAGRSDSDFVEVFVLSRDQVKPPPFAWINYYPIRGIRPGTDVEFLTRFSNMKAVSIDYGDGQVEPWALNTRHRYTKSGVYVVTVRGEDAGSGPGVFHVRVVVD